MASHHKGPSLEHLRQMFTKAEKECIRCEGVDGCAKCLKHKLSIEEALKKKEKHENDKKEKKERDKILAKQPNDELAQYIYEQPGRIAELNKQSKENYAKENPVLNGLENFFTEPTKTINEGITVFGNLANDAKYATQRFVNGILNPLGGGVSRRNRRQKKRISKKRNLRRK
jgi:hypothetical protein